MEVFNVSVIQINKRTIVHWLITSYLPTNISNVIFICNFFAALVWIRAMSSIMEDATLAVKDLVKPLECLREGLSHGDRLCGVLDHIIRDIDRLGPMRPLGLFSVDRGILTSMVSVSVTYLIILIQFRMSLA